MSSLLPVFLTCALALTPEPQALLRRGQTLLTEGHPAEAIAPLEKAAAGTLLPGYTHVLLAQAILEAEAATRYPEAERSMAECAVSKGASPVVREHAGFLLVKLRSAQKSWGPAADAAKGYLAQTARGRRADEVRWLDAEALREAGRDAEALRAYETVWYDATESPWAKEAGARVKELAARGAGKPRELKPEERHDFVLTLQRYGLHDEALAELGLYERQPGAKRDAALALRAGSLHVLRRNAETVRAAENLHKRFPGSAHLPAAALHAIAALRREGDEAAIRSWVHLLEQEHRASPKTLDALYALGVFLQSVHKEAEAVTLLERVAGNPNDNRDDALWKLAWLDRLAGHTPEAVARLKTLLDQLPKSPYRKATLYWLGRFTLSSDREYAAAQLQRLLEEFPHDYYGHQAQRVLAAAGVTPQRIGNGQRFPAFDRLEDPTARPQEAYRLAVELRRAGLDELASEELARVPGAESDPALQFPRAELLSRAGETVEALRLVERSFPEFRQSGSRDPSLVPLEFWHVCYPFRFRAAIEKGARDNGLAASGMPPEMVAALIRTESRFLPTAISPAGAIGLMQLMPRVASRMAQGRGESVGRAELFDPEVNIRYGTRYLASLLRSFGGHREPAIISYNGGADMARAWWEGRPASVELDEWMEQIPFVESRLYLKQILGDAQNYAWIYAIK